MIIQENFFNPISNVLNQLPILKEKDSSLLIPIFEREIPDQYMIKFDDLYKYAEYSGKIFKEALNDILKEHQLKYINIAIDEALIYDYPQLLFEFENLIIIPCSKINNAYQLCEICMDNYLETGNIDYVNYFLEADDASLTGYKEKQIGQQIAYDQVYNQLNFMNQNNMQYEIENQRLDGLQDTLDENNEIVSELEKRESQIPTNINQSINDIEIIKEAKQVRNDLSKKILRGEMTTNSPDINNPSSPNNTSNKPSWFSQKWAAFKTWTNNLNNSQNKKYTRFSDTISKIKNSFNNQKQNQLSIKQESLFFNETIRPIKSHGIKGQPPVPIKGELVPQANPNTKSFVSARSCGSEIIKKPENIISENLINSNMSTVTPVQSQHVPPANPNTKSNVSAIPRGIGDRKNEPNISINSMKQKAKELPKINHGIGAEKNKPPISPEEQNYKRLEKKDVGVGKDTNKKDKSPGGIDHPNTTSPTTQGSKINKDDYIKAKGSRSMTDPLNDTTDLRLLMNEVYRPRRLYKHRYIRG